MPTYVYECNKCTHRFEVLQGITDPPRRRCPRCRGAVKRILMPGGGLIFKGSGFYITDYRKKETQAQEDASPKESKAPGPKATGDAAGSSSGKEDGA